MNIHNDVNLFITHRTQPIEKNGAFKKLIHPATPIEMLCPLREHNSGHDRIRMHSVAEDVLFHHAGKTHRADRPATFPARNETPHFAVSSADRQQVRRHEAAEDAKWPRHPFATRPVFLRRSPLIG